MSQLKLGGNLPLDEVCRSCKHEGSIIVNGVPVRCNDCGGIGYTLTDAGKVICLLITRHMDAKGELNGVQDHHSLDFKLKKRQAV
jgi:hypothetical protein